MTDLTDGQARDVALELLVESPTNPRRRPDPAADEDLAKSVEKLGVLQPVLARPRKGPIAEQRGELELVFGHRRLRAARKANRATIPVVVRELSDLEVLEAQLVENAQRADVHPLDEADGYKRLRDEHGKTVDEIAARIGKSRASVYARLKLCELVGAARKAFEAGKIEASHALLLARIPGEKLQAEALKSITYHGGTVASYRDAADRIQRNFMLRLSDAPFKITDAELVPKAGPCTTCPKRTGNQRELFADVKGADVCTDPVCFGEKRQAAAAVKIAAAKAEGREVLEGKRAQEALAYGSGYARLDDRASYSDPKGRHYRQLLGKSAAPLVVLARDGDRLVELVPKAAATKIIREKGHKWAQPEPKRSSSSSSSAGSSFEREHESRRRLEAAIADALVPKAAKIVAKPGFWRALAKLEADQLDVDPACKRRGLESTSHAALDAWLARASVAELQGVVIESLCSGYGSRENVRELAKLAGVDLAKIARTTRAALVAERKAAKAAKRAKAKAASAPAKSKGKGKGKGKA